MGVRIQGSNEGGVFSSQSPALVGSPYLILQMAIMLYINGLIHCNKRVIILLLM